jgi:serine/threonine protein kinase
VYKNLLCDSQPAVDNVVGKVVPSKVAAAEVATARTVRVADPDARYSGSLMSTCPIAVGSSAIAGDACATRMLRGGANTLLTFPNAGVSWMSYITNTKPSVPQFAQVFATLVRGLSHFHSHDVFHFDLHDDNILVSPSTHTGRFIDFGSSDHFRYRVNGTNYMDLPFIPPLDIFVLNMVYGRPQKFASCADVVQTYTTLWCPRNAPQLGVLFSGMVAVPRDVAEAACAANSALATAAGSPINWPYADVYSLAVAGCLGLNRMLNRTPGVFKAAPPALLTDVFTLLARMLDPNAATRSTARQAWDAMKGLCEAHGIRIPPAEPHQSVLQDRLRRGGVGTSDLGLDLDLD